MKLKDGNIGRENNKQQNLFIFIKLGDLHLSFAWMTRARVLVSIEINFSENKYYCKRIL